MFWWAQVGLPVNSSHGHVVTWSSYHRSTRHTRVSSQSTRYKWAHNKTTSTSRNYLQAVRRHPETVLNMDGVITAICVTLLDTAAYRSRQQITLLRKARSTRHSAVKHDGQLVTRFYGCCCCRMLHVRCDVSHLTADSSAEWSRIRPPSSFVRGQDSTMWDIVCTSPHGHRSESAILRCDELTVWRVDWFPQVVLYAHIVHRLRSHTNWYTSSSS